MPLSRPFTASTASIAAALFGGLALTAALFTACFVSWTDMASRPARIGQETASSDQPAAKPAPVAEPGTRPDDADPVQNELRQVAALALAPHDARGRILLTTAQVEHWSLMPGVGLGEHTLGPAWNTDSTSPSENRRIETADYVLTIPYDPDWGDVAVGVAPFERAADPESPQDAVAFGPIQTEGLEFAGAFRALRFHTVPRQDIESLLQTHKNEEGCVDPNGPRPTPNEAVRIGGFVAERYAPQACEGGSIVAYTLIGKHHNYVFTSAPIPDEALLRWTVERFREK